MAKVYLIPNHKDWEQRKGEDFDAYYKRQQKLFDALPQDKMISFGVADGGAHYLVHSMKPLILYWVPYMDRYQADAILIRGLRASDVQHRLRGAATMRRMFSKQS